MKSGKSFKRFAWNFLGYWPDHVNFEGSMQYDKCFDGRPKFCGAESELRGEGASGRASLEIWHYVFAFYETIIGNT
jgi:hypothetical protein